MSHRIKNTYCSYCGSQYKELTWPRHCTECNELVFKNPIPVAVVLVPVDDKLLVIRRDIEPERGKIALPGGCIDYGETWQEGCSRELREETDVVIDPKDIYHHWVTSSPNGIILIFGITKRQKEYDLPPFKGNRETSERLLIARAEKLAFPLQTQAVENYFEGIWGM